MKPDLFHRYVWLVEVVRHAEKITFERIADLWLKSSLNSDRSPLALRTFHNHRDAVANLFGIRILCDRSDHNQYFISPGDSADFTKLKMWMLQTLTMDAVGHRVGRNLSARVLLDSAPADKYGLNGVIEAMRQGKMLQIAYSFLTTGNSANLMVSPYCVRFWRSSWYIIGKDAENDSLMALDLARVISLVVTDKSFVYPSDFSPEKFLGKFFGMEIDSELPAEAVRLKVFGRTRDKIRTLPFHGSQKEMLADLSYSIFEYNLVPSDDFINAILSHSTDMEVLSPEWLRSEVATRIHKMARLYAMPELEKQSVGMGAAMLNDSI